MKEIKIEKKKSNGSLMVIGFVVLAVVAYLIYSRNSKNDDTISSISSAYSNSIEVNAYLMFMDKKNQPVSLDHSYFNGALIKLVDATDAVADIFGLDTKSEKDILYGITERITRDPYATTHSGDIQKAGVIITMVLNSIQEKKFPNLSAEATELQRTLAVINPQVLTLDQTVAINAYFTSAAALLQKMNQNN